MGESLIAKIRGALGKQTQDFAPKYSGGADGTTISVDLGVDVRYAPTIGGKRYIEMTEKKSILSHLLSEYERLSKLENPEHHQNEIFEYYMKLTRFTRESENIIGRQKQLKTEGTKAVENLKSFNNKIKYNVGGADRVVLEKAINILMIASKIEYLNQASFVLNDKDNMNNFERDYWFDRPVRN